MSIGYSTATLELIKTLLPVVPKGLDSFVFLNSGSEAVEVRRRGGEGNDGVQTLSLCWS